MKSDDNFGGISITIPFKESYANEDIIYECSFSKKSRIINTLVKKNGQLYGYNTDLYGIQKTFESL